MIETIAIIAGSLIGALVYKVLSSRQRPKVCADVIWYEVSKHPVPIPRNTDWYSQKTEGFILFSDGEIIREPSSLNYNKKGELIMSSYNQAKVTHWTRIPLPGQKVKYENKL